MGEIHSNTPWQKVNTYLKDNYVHPHTKVSFNLNSMFRLKVPGGWLIAMCSHLDGNPSALTFYPDNGHGWLPDENDY